MRLNITRAGHFYICPEKGYLLLNWAVGGHNPTGRPGKDSQGSEQASRELGKEFYAINTEYVA